MNGGMQLHIVREGEEMPGLSLGQAPLYIGRAPDNHLVVPDSTVSSRHAALWVEAGRAWIRDTGSRNGTFVNDERIRGATALADGDKVRLGSNTDLVARGHVEEPEDGPKLASRLVEDVGAGVRYPFQGDRFYIGASDIADLRVDVESEQEGAVSLHPDGEIWKSTYEEEAPVALGDTFEIAGRTFRVIEVPTSFTQTHEAAPARFAYQLRVTLDGVAGAEAVFTDPSSGKQHTVDAENRAILLYMLAKRVVDAKNDPELRGDTWCADEDVSRGVWGRKGTADANSLHVLVHRLRKELKGAGFDPWFIEKRRKAIRIALPDVEVD